MEVAVVDAAASVVAVSRSGADGGFTLQTSRAEGWVVAKLREPLLGVAFAPTGGQLELDFNSSEAHTLVGAIVQPEGIPFDWVQVEATPRQLPGVPQAVIDALQIIGTGNARSGSYSSRRVTAPEVALEVLPGTWELRFEHIVESPPMPFGAPPCLAGGVLELADGTRPPRVCGAHLVEVSEDTRFTVHMRVLEREEL